MRKFHMLGLALLSAIAFCTIAVGSAFAESEFLVGGVAAIAGEPIHEEEELELIALKQTFFNLEVKVRCSGLTIESFTGANDAIVEKIFSLTQEELTELAGGIAEECVNVANCPEPLVYPEDLPWLVEVVLSTSGKLLVHITEAGKGMPGAEFECMGIGLTNLCIGLTSGITENLISTFVTIFNRAEEEAENEGGTCTEGGPAYVAGSILTLEVNGKAVAVS